ncbi:hypothetical protein INT47_001829 [Mucor saturninus]|uniref:Uncharacterized protein n=1 Tax=Mucor saturninus TaxID=64648 RepID=A0A8H7ULN2_9FUNG|nr:hypothetical protein INT47_001829 [Mucor saturninus]
MRSRVNAGENANNIMEGAALFSFMRNTKMVNFNPTPPKLETDFVEHPSGNVDFGQLWAPFYQEFVLTGSADNDCLIAGDHLTMKSIVSALKSYKKRFFSLPEPIHRIQINVESILPAGKLWQDSHVYSAAIFKQGLSKSIAKRGGEHVLFHSNHQTRRRGRISQVTNCLGVPFTKNIDPSNTPEMMTNFTTFTRLVYSAFANSNPTINAEGALKNLINTGSAAVYATEFRRLT